MYKPFRHVKPDPMGEPRNPFQVFLLLVSLLNGTASLFGSYGAGSVAQYASNINLFIWGFLLFIGSLATLMGMYWLGDKRDGLLVKRMGLVALASPTLIYGIILLMSSDGHARYAGMIMMGFTLAAAIQAHRVNSHIKAIIQLTEHLNGHGENND